MIKNIPIYLDNQATTPIDPNVLKAMNPYLSDNFGNPASNHYFGWQAQEAIEIAREQVASIINAKTNEIIVGGKEDLGTGLVLVSVVIDIERIGDYTKNIYDLAVNHPKKLNGGSLEDCIAEIEKTVLGLFEESINAFKNQDIEKARLLMGQYKKNISTQADEITNEIVMGKISDLDVGSASAVGLYSRYLKRIAAHSRNIISSVVNPFERIGYPE